MKRRDFIQAFSALLTTGALPAFAGAQNAGDAFDAAVADKPWLKAFKGVGDATQDLHCESLAISGRWPAQLRGRFYRNGPALFERGGQRYRHWFDGDGMVQQFSFDGRNVSHRGRLVRTPKLLAEQRAGRFLFSAFGTGVKGDAPAQGPDSFNTANTNAIEHAGRVLAMWEGGSAFALDPKDLSHARRGDVEGRPAAGAVLGAPEDRPAERPPVEHRQPRRASSSPGTSTRNGRLVDAQIGASPYPRGMVHDMAITARHLVVPLPPVKLDFARVVAGDRARAGLRVPAARAAAHPRDEQGTTSRSGACSSCRRSSSFTSATRTSAPTATSRSASSARRTTGSWSTARSR